MRALALLAAVAPLALASLTLAAAVPAAAQERSPAVCKNRSEIIGILGRKFGETQRSFGLQNDARVLELYASSNGSWTALLTLPSGQSCVVAAGEAWTVLPPMPSGEPA